MLKGENFGKAVLSIAELDRQVSCSRQIRTKVSASNIRSETSTLEAFQNTDAAES